MDLALQRLKRLAAANPEEKDRYIAALERAVGGLQAEDHPNLEDAKVVRGWITDVFYDDIQALSPYTIRNDGGERIGLLVNIFWEDSFDLDDEEAQERVAEIQEGMSENTAKLLEDAAQLGYHQIVLWH
jgi:hypothetical protein